MCPFHTQSILHHTYPCTWLGLTHCTEAPLPSDFLLSSTNQSHKQAIWTLENQSIHIYLPGTTPVLCALGLVVAVLVYQTPDKIYYEAHLLELQFSCQLCSCQLTILNFSGLDILMHLEMLLVWGYSLSFHRFLSTLPCLYKHSVKLFLVIILSSLPSPGRTVTSRLCK
jgi:hypothetical protein